MVALEQHVGARADLKAAVVLDRVPSKRQPDIASNLSPPKIYTHTQLKITHSRFIPRQLTTEKADPSVFSAQPLLNEGPQAVTTAKAFPLFMTGSPNEPVTLMGPP